MIAQNEMVLPLGVVALSNDEMHDVEGGLVLAIIGAAVVVAAAVGVVYLAGYAVGYLMN